MDKISGIIPGSARVTAVDMKDTTPVRPGTPAFGRPEHLPPPKTAAETALPTASAQKGVAVHQQMSDWRSKDSAQAALAAKLSEQFFSRPGPDGKDTAPPMPTDATRVPAVRAAAVEPKIPFTETSIASKPAGFKNEEFQAMREAQMRPFDSLGHDDQEMAVEEMPRMKQPDGLFPKGSFLDRTA